MKDQPLRSLDDLIAEVKGKSIEELANEPWDCPHLITVDELRAAGALDVPSAWRKSLGEERDLFSGLTDGNDDTLPEKQEPTPRDPDANASAEGRVQ